ncbi:SNF2 family N-terminal domain-containing protein [Dactylonectria macrodidyma]|uniref:SNF2 family N-terminal domain-containing protein n=1 Tax=Dactylonectria macrodidyma TaxID=307937 RepID=A0A9P9FLR8_9HYPO|nr:SNF2 family N-terminal domain-containing protein [Dactylonectria macrodidyma]
MPRGRPAAQGPSTPSAANDSRDASSTGTGRLTRSASTRNLVVPSVVADPSSTPASAEKRPRGRPRKTTLPVDETTSPATAPTRRGRGRPSKASLLGSESVSTVPTPLGGTSESEYSTPGTSIVPTPAASDRNKSSSFEVHLSGTRQNGPDRERGLRNSIYSMKSAPKGKKTEINDTDEEEEGFSDTTPDATLARRLQEAEFHNSDKATPSQLPVRRRNTRGTASTISAPPPAAANPPVTKRGRASTVSSTKLSHPSKRARVIADSDDSDIDMDAEIAAAVDLESGMDPVDSDADVSLPDTNEGSDDDGDDDEDDLSEDDAPLARRIGKARPTARSSVAKGKRPLRPMMPAHPRATKTRISSVLDDSADELTELETDVSASGLSEISTVASGLSSTDNSDTDMDQHLQNLRRIAQERRAYRRPGNGGRRLKKERDRLEANHPEIITMWQDLENMPVLKAGRAPQPQTISRQLKNFQLEGLAWMNAMEKTEWKGGLLGDEMGLGKTIQAVSLIMSDYPAKQPSLVLVPPVALMQWQQEIKSYTDGTLKTFVYHGTNQKAKSMTAKELKRYDVIMMSYNSLESIYRKQEKGFKRKDGIYKEKSVIHSINFHRAILDEAHCIKTRTTMTAKACFALKTDFRWCLTGTPLQNRIGEFFSLIRFLNIRPFASYLCKQCPCSTLEWNMNEDSRCTQCNHAGMQHVSVFNQELLNPIQKFGNLGPGREAFRKLRLMTDRIMLRRLKKDHTNAMELPVKEIYVDRQFFGEEENDFANSIMTSGKRKFDTYVAQGVLLNNYANIFGLIMQMRQVADHPDLILKKNADGGQNILVCCICDEPAEDTIRSRCKHDFCRACVGGYVRSTAEPDCPRCHIPLSIDLEQPEIEQDENLVKKNSIINRIKMENWTSSSKIELLVHELHKLRSDNASHKSIIFSQFTTMLQLIEWRLRRAGITTVMLDGSMTPAQRQASIDHFMTNVNVECFLVSLKAGGVALNLTEASRVFIVDPWWNPAAEWQSADRCHRIGQTRPCTITRLCIEDSVESRMVLIQEKKTNMIHSTVNGDDKAMDSLSPEDMQFLFRGS